MVIFGIDAHDFIAPLIGGNVLGKVSPSALVLIVFVLE